MIWSRFSKETPDIPIQMEAGKKGCSWSEKVSRLGLSLKEKSAPLGYTQPTLLCQNSSNVFYKCDELETEGFKSFVVAIPKFNRQKLLKFK